MPSDPGRPPRRTLSIVMPALNEEGNIASAVERWAKVAGALCDRYEVIVVDDGSTDRTADLVRIAAREDSSVRLVRHERNRGYGAALRSGFAAASHDLVFFTDADNQFDPNEIDGFLELSDQADVVAGYRIDRRDPAGRRLIAWGWNHLMRLLFYVPIRDINCAFKLFRRSALESLELQSVGNAINTELVVKLSRSGHRILERGVHHFPRTAGKATGFSVGMIRRALTDLVRLYGPLSRPGSR